MTQQAINDYLKLQRKTWFTTEQIAIGTKLALSSVTKTMKVLRTYKEVLFKEEHYHPKYSTLKRYLYKYKRGMR